MAKSKSTATTPKAKSKVSSTPRSAPAIPAVLKMASPSSAHDDTNDDVSDAASAPVAEAPTPARKQTKRKAPQDDTAAITSTTTTKKPKTLVHTEQAESTSTSASGKKTTQKHRAVRIEIPASSVSTPINTGKHIVFDDANVADGEEDPSEFFTPQEDVKTNPLEAQLSKATTNAESEPEDDESDDDDDDDEAPEAVSTSTAAAQAAKATQAAARAVEQQQDVERRKRQERDAKFRKQAEARKKQQQDSADKTAEKKRKKVDGESESEDADADADDGNATTTKPEARLVTSLATSSRKRLDRRNLPSVLPDEFLESDSEAEEDVEEGSSARPKKITFNTAARQVVKAEPRHPADQRVGATVYRVMKKQGETKLAPKGGKYSKNAKEMLLGRGRTVPKTGVKKKGFLVR